MEIVGSWSDTYGAKALAGIVDRIVERDYVGSWIPNEARAKDVQNLDVLECE